MATGNLNQNPAVEFPPQEIHAAGMNAILALEDGTWYRGVAAGATGEAHGEVVFNTSMTGYQEVLTDPSYAGQIVTMTYPMIGNTGINLEDIESRKPFLEGFIVRQMSPIASNWRTTQSLDDYLIANRIPVISDIDTRALVRLTRVRGAMKGLDGRPGISASDIWNVVNYMHTLRRPASTN